MKGIIDSIFIPAVIFLLIIVFAISIFLFNSFIENFKKIDQNNEIVKAKDKINEILVIALLMLIFGLPLASVILALFFGSNPGILPISIFLLILGVFLSAIFKEVIIEFFNNLEYLEVLKTNEIFATFINYYPLIMFIFGIIIIIAQLINKIYVQ
ncbi:MAG: hypothetical protein QXL82_03130 [Candidatus Aenigmatarchaeota archaeon]